MRGAGCERQCIRRCEGWGRARCEGGIETDGRGVTATGWLTCIPKLIVDLDILNIGKLFEILHDRTRDGIQRAIGLTRAAEIDMRNTVSIFDFAIAGKTVEHQGKTLIALDTHRTLEIFIEDGTNNIS